jgi:hypothetical protein
MSLAEMFEDYGIGVLATAGADGKVNTAVYARPHQLNETTLVWGMTEGLTYDNVTENPNASFLFKTTAAGFTGVRITLKMLRSVQEGELLTRIREHTDQVVGPGAGDPVTNAVVFEIVDTRPLF